MKRFCGGVLALAGGVAVIWAGVHLLAGSSNARVTFTQDFSINALTGGLVGVALLTMGLVWARD